MASVGAGALKTTPLKAIPRSAGPEFSIPGGPKPPKLTGFANFTGVAGIK